MTVLTPERVPTEQVHYMRVSPGFFNTLGLRLISGRDFDERDRHATDAKDQTFRSVIISESFARRYFGNRNPLGARLGFGVGPSTQPNMEIIGVVQGFTRRSLRDRIEQAFFPSWEAKTTNGTFYVRVRGKAESALPSIRATVAKIDPSLPLISPITLEEQIDQSLTTERLLATLSTGFGAIALTLSVVGLYGVMSFIVTRRTQEIGIRMALGATRRDVVWLIGRDTLVMIGLGTAVALPSAWMLRRLVESQLYGVSAVDVPTIVAATVVLAMVALGAAVLPSWRATMVSPTESLRPE
jgi:predicted permease